MYGGIGNASNADHQIRRIMNDAMRARLNVAMTKGCIRAMSDSIEDLQNTEMQ